MGFVGGGASLENYQAAAEGRGQKGAEGSGGDGHRWVCVVDSHSISTRQPKRERSAVALVVDRNVQLWCCLSQLLGSGLANHSAHVLEQHRDSLQLAFRQSTPHGSEP